MIDWNKQASNLLKAELKRHGIEKYDELRDKLEAIGVNETTANLTVKINRGTFSFSFFLQVMKAINANVFRIGEN